MLSCIIQCSDQLSVVLLSLYNTSISSSFKLLVKCDFFFSKVCSTVFFEIFLILLQKALKFFKTWALSNFLVNLCSELSHLASNSREIFRDLCKHLLLDIRDFNLRCVTQIFFVIFVSLIIFLLYVSCDDRCKHHTLLWRAYFWEGFTNLGRLIFFTLHSLRHFTISCEQLTVVHHRITDRVKGDSWLTAWRGRTGRRFCWHHGDWLRLIDDIRLNLRVALEEGWSQWSSL